MLVRKITSIAFALSISFASIQSATAAAAPKWYAPISHLPRAQQLEARCILLAESHSSEAHPNLRDTDPESYGPFQFTTILWNRWSWVAGVGLKAPIWFLGTTALYAVTIPAYRATLYQQAEVFATVMRIDGSWPWSKFDGC